MFKLFVFDLDNTLIPSNELEEFRGASNVNNSSSVFETPLIAKIKCANIQPLITTAILNNILDIYPDAKFAIFTTAPRFYAAVLVSYFYPSFTWCSIIGFEDVEKTKPSPLGIFEACIKADLKDSDDLKYVAIIGDSEKDIKAAYQAGCWSVLYLPAWPAKYAPEHWRAFNLLPDITVKNAEDLVEALKSPHEYLLALESEITVPQTASSFQSTKTMNARRFCSLPDVKDSVTIKVMGRMFAEYQELDLRREWHELTTQIHAHKDAITFPIAWIAALRNVISHDLTTRSVQNFFKKTKDSTIITCIPRKPNREARLEHLIEQLHQSHDEKPISNEDMAFNSEILRFKDGAKSHHKEHLNAQERFKNARDNLEVAMPNAVKGKIVLVIDDVLTSGATFYYAAKYLKDAGAKEVVSLALTQTISAGSW